MRLVAERASQLQRSGRLPPDKQRSTEPSLFALYPLLELEASLAQIVLEGRTQGDRLERLAQVFVPLDGTLVVLPLLRCETSARALAGGPGIAC